MTPSDFCLPDGYVENLTPAYHDESGPGDPDAMVSQPDVYPRAMELAEERGAHSILDLGCGRGSQLAAIHDAHPGWVYGGIDYGPNIKGCERRYDWGHWIELDLETLEPFTVADVIVIADVIEHLVDPRPMLQAVRTMLAAVRGIAVISTPDRILTRGLGHLGPPPSPMHVREWNRPEFDAFLEHQGLHVERLDLTRSDDQHAARHTLLAEVTVPGA